MRVAVIGGGAAGLVTAHLLDGKHQVTLFERQPIVGGHVRTLNGNVLSSLTKGQVLDAGVLEFERRNFPKVLRLFDSLGCTLVEVEGTTTLFDREGRHHLSPGSLARIDSGRLKRVRGLLHAWLALGPQALAFDLRCRQPLDRLVDRPLRDFLTDAVMDRWAALLTSYAYSIPYSRVGEAPAELCLPMLHDFLRATGWVGLQGGAWDYQRRILERFTGTVHTSAVVKSVARSLEGVQLIMADGTHLAFDKVVFAAPPDQTLKLLADPSEAETRRFGAWQASHIHTLVHCDASVRSRRGVSVACEFDVYEKSGGRGGYNAYLNKLCQNDDSPVWNLAFGLDDEIDPATVLHRQEHHTPRYTVAAWKWHREVIDTNGENHTFHAGAWLGDGLHEGAVTSAVRVSDLLGGASV